MSALLEAETGHHYAVARAGDQTGDAFSPTSGVTLQAKHYFKTDIHENEVVGEISKILGLVPATDVYVLGTTRASAQLRQRLDQTMRDTGLDIVVAELRDAPSELGSICVTHWSVVEKFFKPLSKASPAWIAHAAKEATTQALLQTFRQQLQGLGTMRHVAELAKRSLQVRARGEGAGARAHNRVLLEKAVARPTAEDALHKWWTTPKQPLAVIEAEDGLGKTWLAARFTLELATKEHAIVFWMDSAEWQGCEDIEGLLGTAVSTVIPTDTALRDRIVRKSFHRWPQPVLLILDGANEHGAWQVADRLLRQYDQHREFLSPRVRMLITTRPLGDRPRARPDFWRGCKSIPLSSYNPDELRDALAILAPGVTPDQIPPSLRELCSIPRYCALCVKLRSRLASLDRVTKEILLWEDLREKLETGDPTISSLHKNAGESPEELLARLAQQAGWPDDGARRNITSDALRPWFSNLAEARADLVGQRIAVGGGLGSIQINANHLIIGWALVLREVALSSGHASRDDCVEAMRRLLEPASSNDSKVSALHSALMLTFLKPTTNASLLTNGRASLFVLWVRHHNATVAEHDLDHFSAGDIEAYTCALETLFRGYLPGSVETQLVVPLARIWRGGTGVSGLLQVVLERWLRLVYPGGSTGSKDGKTEPPERFPVAAGWEQLRLSYAAISVISQRPTRELLPPLADCLHSISYCYRDHETGQKNLRIPVKLAYDIMEVLLRWGYTEMVLPEICERARQYAAGSDERDAWVDLAKCLHCKLPEDLAATEQDSSNPSDVELVNSLGAFLDGNKQQARRLVFSDSLEMLACRTDVAELSSTQVVTLRQEVEKLLQQPKEAVVHGTVVSMLFLRLLPWLARYDASAFHTICADFARLMFAAHDPVAALMDLDKVMPTTDAAQPLVERALQYDRLDDRFGAIAGKLTELVLLHATPDQVCAWFEKLNDVSEPRISSVVSILPIPFLISALAPPELASRAEARVQELVPQFAADPGNETNKQRLYHWLAIWADASPPSVEKTEWALAQVPVLCVDENLLWPLFHTAVCCGNRDVFFRALREPRFQNYQKRFRWPPLAGVADASLRFEELQPFTNLSVSGELLLASGNDTELFKWGQAVANIAMTAASEPGPVLERPESVVVHVDENGRYQGLGIKSLPKGQNEYHTVYAGVWGINRASSQPSPTQADYDRLCEQFHSDFDKLSEWAGLELSLFDADKPLKRWAELAPDEFRAFTEKFLTRLATSRLNNSFHLSQFASSVAFTLFQLSPAPMMELALKLSKGSRHRVMVYDSGLSKFTQQLWRTEFSAHKEAVELRYRELADASDDEALLWNVLAARLGGTISEVNALAKKWVLAPVARERALGVLLLGYSGDPQALPMLDALAKSDPSKWVRMNALWSARICRQDLSARAAYEHALSAADLPELAARLAVVRPALLPLAYDWKRIAHSPSFSDPRMRIFHDLFWYHWSHKSSNQRDLTLLGRKLKEHCRGETLKSGVTDHMAPWWQP